MAFNKAKALEEAEKLVSQGKLSLAIRQYLQIIEKEPSDLSLLNTVGDLYARDKNVPEALKQFHKLAEAYVQEGFNLKAVAIYKKISKLEPGSVETLLKLAQLYALQGLAREAREQYAQAVDYYRKKNQNEKALEVFRKIVQLDPENAAIHLRLAEFSEQIGRKSDAAQVYLETAELAFRRSDLAAAETAVKKAASLDENNPQLRLFRARLASSKKRWDEVEKILSSATDLNNHPVAQQLLLRAYLATQKLESAKSLVLAVFRANPGDFDPLAQFAGLCLAKGDIDAALKPLAEVADQLIEQKNTAPLVERLREIWAKSPHHVDTLELLYRVCEKTADELTLPEVLEALANAYVQTGQLEKAEETYQKLVSREPANEHYKGLLKQVLEKQGKEVVATSPEGLADVELALAPEAEEAAAAPAVDGEQAAQVNEALENSDLYARYGLADKAVAELDKVLVKYPDQVDIHQRILEICQRNRPSRAAQAAQALARIYAQRGDRASAQKFQILAGGVSVPPAGASPSPPAAGASGFEPPFHAPAAEEGSPERPREVPLDLATSPGVSAVETPLPSAPEANEFDLSGDLEAVTAPPSAAPAAPEPPPFNYEDSRVEIDFYLEQGMMEEAKRIVEALKDKKPGDPRIAELRQRVEQYATRQVVTDFPAPPPSQHVEPTPAATAAGIRAPSEKGALPASFGLPPRVDVPVAGGPRNPQEVATNSIPAPAEPAAAGRDLLGSLAGQLASSLEGIEPPVVQPSPLSESRTPSKKMAGNSASPLSDLLEELGEESAQAATETDAETHYNLGVAFREMGLLDEAIGEFQKVVKGAQKGKLPPNFLQACSLLAVCFMDKKMPAIAVKWYLRALEAPGLEEEALLALHYDLGVAYEQAGDTRTALEKYSEVYSQNIDFRDVAEKIRLLQQKTI